MLECCDEVTYWQSRFVPLDDEDHTLHIERLPGFRYTESREQLFRRLGLMAIVSQIKGK